MFTLGLAASAIASYIADLPAPMLAADSTKTSFTKARSYWAKTFIETLAERKTMTENCVDREATDESIRSESIVS